MQKVRISYIPSTTNSTRRIKDMYGNEVKEFRNELITNSVNPAPR